VTAGPHITTQRVAFAGDDYHGDLFEVKAKALTRRGHIESDWKSDRQELATRYSDRDFRRNLVVRLECSGSKAVYANGRISFEIDLPAGGAWHACCKYDLVANDKVRPAPEQCAQAYDRLESAHSLAHWKHVTTQITTPNECHRPMGRVDYFFVTRQG
jgi:hypothetical protein